MGEFATAGSELELRLRGRSCGGDGWRACGKAQTGQEGPDDLGLGEHGNHLTPSRASGTLQNVKLEHPAHQVRPAQIPLPQGCQVLGQQVISTAASGASSVFAADVDGDGDLDVLSASMADDQIAWYENRTIHRSVVFPAPTTISTAADEAQSVFAADVDGDGDLDVLSASQADSRIAWYENTDGG